MLKEMERVVRECGVLLTSASGKPREIQEKEGPANFVTQYDVAVQQRLRDGLLALAPQAQFVGEEEGAHGDVRQGAAFVVDPIDGTTNFIKDYRHCAISVGMLQDGAPVRGVIYDPYTQSLFSAEQGKGAFLNGAPIHVSPHGLAQGLVCFGTAPYYPALTDQTFALARSLFENALDLRRSGSAAIDLCSVAAGRCELMFELRLSPWDYAAAAVIVAEAGGMISQVDGSPLHMDQPCSVLAAAPRAYEEFFEKGMGKLV